MKRTDQPVAQPTPAAYTCPRCGGTGKSPSGGMCAACFGGGQLRNSALAVTA